MQRNILNYNCLVYDSIMCINISIHFVGMYVDTTPICCAYMPHLSGCSLGELMQ